MPSMTLVAILLSCKMRSIVAEAHRKLYNNYKLSPTFRVYKRSKGGNILNSSICDVEAHVLYRTKPLRPHRLRVGPNAEGNLIGNSNRGLEEEI
jgi:hypothetical protein